MSAPQRTIREEDLLFWAQKILELDKLPVPIDFCNGVLMVQILQRVLRCIFKYSCAIISHARNHI